MDYVSGQVIGQAGQPAGGVATVPAQPQVGYQTPGAGIVPGVAAQNSQALFTQEQLNSIIGSRLAPVNQRVTDLTAQLGQSQQLAASYLEELNGYKQRETARAAGVPEAFISFAVFEASKLAVNGKDFATALKEFITANQGMFGAPQQAGQQAQPTQQLPAQGVMQPTQQPSPVVPQSVAQPAVQPTTPGVATQQPGKPAVGFVQQPGVLPNTVVPYGAAQPQPSAQQAQMVAQPPLPGVQYGSSGVGGVTGHIQDVNSVDAAVSALLTKKGVKGKVG